MINVHIYSKKINIYSDSDIHCTYVYAYLHVHKSTHILLCVLSVRSTHIHNACVYTSLHSCSVECADEQNRQYHCSHAPPITWEDDAHAPGT